MTTPFSFQAFAPDFATSERFVRAVTGSPDTRLALLLHDTKELVERYDLPPMHERTTPAVFPATVYGTLAEVWERIIATQGAGGAASFRPNVRAPDPDQAQHGLPIYTFRSVFADLDSAPSEEVLEVLSRCPPTAKVLSRRYFHLYWALRGCVSEDEWSASQRAFTQYLGGDAHMNAPGSQLRLPGTWNFKDPEKPHFLKAEVEPDRRYLLKDLLERLGLKPLARPPRRESRPLAGAVGEAAKNWLADHGEEFLQVRKYQRCPVCGGDGGCKPTDDMQKLICFSTHHPNTGVGTLSATGNGYIFGALDIAREGTPLPVFLREQTDDDGNPYLTGGCTMPEPHSTSTKMTQENQRAAGALVVPTEAANEPHTEAPLDEFARFACKASEVKEEPIEWVTPGWLVRGKLHLVEGDKGCAKSTMTIDALASLSRGRGWLGGVSRPPANALIVAPEDGASDTISPRLRAADADLDRIFIQTLDAGTPVFPDVIPFLERFVREKNIEYIVIDSLMSCLGERNSHKDQEVRAALMPLKTMLERTGCTALAIRHLNKNVGASAGHRGMGSVAFAAIARIVWLLAKDPDDELRFVLSRSVGNLGRRPKSRIYSVRASSPDAADVRIAWGPEVDITADDLVAKPDAGATGGKLEAAANFLRERLANGAVAAKDLERAALANGISRATFYRARETLCIQTNKGMCTLTSMESREKLVAGFEKLIDEAA